MRNTVLFTSEGPHKAHVQNGLDRLFIEICSLPQGTDYRREIMCNVDQQALSYVKVLS